MDYKCGTGHGVGNILNVHEGPHVHPRAHQRWDVADLTRPCTWHDHLR